MRKRIGGFFVSTVLLGLAAGCAPVLATDAPQEWRADAVRMRVVDGDTLHVADPAGGEGVYLRLQGVDAPERDERGFFQAGAWLEQRLEAGGLVCRQTRTRSGRPESSRGRPVVVCAAGAEADLSRAMVRAGYARAIAKFRRDLVAEEQRAASERRGLWARGGFAT